MTPVELQIVRAILIQNDRDLEDYKFVDLPQAKGVGVVVVTQSGEVQSVEKLTVESVTYYSVVQTPRKRISKTSITFYRDSKLRTVFVAEKNDSLVETNRDQLRAVAASPANR